MVKKFIFRYFSFSASEKQKKRENDVHCENGKDSLKNLPADGLNSGAIRGLPEVLVCIVNWIYLQTHGKDNMNITVKIACVRTKIK